MTNPAIDSTPDLDNCSPVDAARHAAGHLSLVEEIKGDQICDEPQEAEMGGLPLSHRELAMGQGASFSAPFNDGKLPAPTVAFSSYVSKLEHRCTASPDYLLTGDVDIIDLLSGIGATLLDVDYSSPDWDGTLRLNQLHVILDECHLLVSALHSTQLNVHTQACASDPAALHRALQAVDKALRPHRYVAPPERAQIRAWWLGANGPVSSRDYIEAPSFEASRSNYPPPVASALDQMLQSLREGLQRIHVWHGPPGTGKTSAVRTIAQDFSDVLEVHVVMDPEQLLKGGVAYMMQIISGCKQTDKQYLLVLEDAGQMVTEQAGQQHGEALSRLLNLTDGILGQNAKISVLITTNEDIGKLHPALLRAGRCGSQIDFCAFTREQAAVWCQAQGFDESLLKDGETSLAQLYSLGSPEAAPVRSSSKRKTKLGFCMPGDEAIA